ncbi:TIGR03790 family protein [Akkermansiaceae bacterium]|nr:TIGR03790 family protein [Akkermansiaceae bacterium]
MIRLLIFALLPFIALGNPAPLQPHQVAVVYNAASQESRQLAEFYALNRRIPNANLVGLVLPKEETITRSAFEKRVRDPLRAEFDKREWWIIGQDPTGVVVPTSCRIRCLALMKGVPLRISRAEVPASEAESTGQFKVNNEASVDSDLALLGVRGVPIGGPVANKYYNKDVPFVQMPLPYLLLVGRIDAKDYLTCQRMILDALDAEDDGLWGNTYVDFALKGGAFEMGEKWLEGITKRSMEAGFPTITDRQKDTFVTNYPMNDAAVYFGWYTFHRNGPFLNPQMKFQPGAIAVHLHSLSAAQLTNPAANWSSALLDRGAAATLGNTWEPYLQLSHNFDIFHDRLLKGYSLVESASMAMNVISWQNLVLGDPLYRPFKNRSQKPKEMETAKDYKVLRMAHEHWKDENERNKNLKGAAERMKSATLYEAQGFAHLEKKNYEAATAAFTTARTHSKDRSDQLRQILNQVELERRKKNTSGALSLLRKAAKEYRDLPEIKSVQGLMVILDPPAPPATKPKK